MERASSEQGVGGAAEERDGADKERRKSSLQERCLGAAGIRGVKTGNGLFDDQLGGVPIR